MALGTIARHTLKSSKREQNNNTPNIEKPMRQQTDIVASQQA
jgi:zinc metalloprotease